ncbi:MAG: ABC transporter substrate-binding protein [Nocardioides sp.]
MTVTPLLAPRRPTAHGAIRHDLARTAQLNPHLNPRLHPDRQANLASHTPVESEEWVRTALDAGIDARFDAVLDELTRRRLLTAATAGVALLGLDACGSSQTSSNDAAAKDSAWTFTDDLGRTIHLPSRPARIASLWDSTTATLWAAGLRDVVASQLAPGNTAMLTAAGVDRGGIRRLSIGNTAQVNLEALAAATPDLIIDITDTTKGGARLATTHQEPQITKIAPVVGLDSDGPDIVSIITRAERLIRALGVPVADQTEQGRYQAAAQRLRSALEAKPGLRFVFCWTDGSDVLYLYAPDGSTGNPWSPTLAALGMDFTPVHTSAGPSAGGFGTVSWELVPDLPVDVLLQTGGTWPITNPGWQAMPAVRASQAHNTDTWGPGWYLTDYANYTSLLNHLTTITEDSRPGVGPQTGSPR